jgi:hypothetical protein
MQRRMGVSMEGDVDRDEVGSSADVRTVLRNGAVTSVF